MKKKVAGIQSEGSGSGSIDDEERDIIKTTV
jgi:hypothetical protein